MSDQSRYSQGIVGEVIAVGTVRAGWKGGAGVSRAGGDQQACRPVSRNRDVVGCAVPGSGRMALPYPRAR